MKFSEAYSKSELFLMKRRPFKRTFVVKKIENETSFRRFFQCVNCKKYYSRLGDLNDHKSLINTCNYEPWTP